MCGAFVVVAVNLHFHQPYGTESKMLPSEWVSSASAQSTGDLELLKGLGLALLLSVPDHIVGRSSPCPLSKAPDLLLRAQ